MPFLEHRSRKIPHYHGDIVRKLFVAAGVILLVALPIFSELLPISTISLIVAIVVMIFFAALTNPKLRWTNIIDVLIATVGVVVFEFLAVVNYAIDGMSFIASQALALIFLFALYYSARTARAIATGQLDPDKVEEVQAEDDTDMPGEEVSNEEALKDIKRGHGF